MHFSKGRDMRFITQLFKFIFSLLLIVLGGITVALFIWAPGFIFSTVNSVEQTSSTEPLQETQEFHASLFIADLHDDSLAWRLDITRRNKDGHSDIPRLIEGGVNLVVYSSITKSMMSPGTHNDDSSIVTNVQSILQTQPPKTWFSSYNRAIYQAEKLVRFESRAEGALIALNTDERIRDFLTTPTKPGIVGAMLSTEGLHALEGNIDNFDHLYEAGYRIFGMAHLFDNAFAGSSQGVEQYGLTNLGKELVRKGDDYGVVWDLAHASQNTITDLLAITKRPVIVSHTGVKAICEHPRNLSDDQIVAIANGGGIIGIGFWKAAMCEVSTDAIVQSIRHVVNLVGVQHVAIGSDFNGSVTTPFDSSDLSLLTQTLLDNGFSQEEVRAIMGENLRRVLLSTV